MRHSLKGWMVLILLLGMLTYAIAEELTLTTYYPSPRGVYNELRTRGDVAIGKLDQPAARLEIIGGGATSATSALRIRNVDQTPLLEVQNGGNIGIGTGSPSSKLHVAGGDINVGGGKVINLANPTVGTDAATKAYVDLMAVPSGVVMFFNLSACPAGWSPYAAATGRYVVGASTSIGGTVGTALSNQENRVVGRHAHSGSISSSGEHTHTYQYGNPGGGTPWVLQVWGYNGGSLTTGSFTGGTHTHALTLNDAGSLEGTNAPYIQLLVCQKN